MSIINTVTGPIDSSQLGICLPHEHLFNNVTSWSTPSKSKGIDSTEFLNAKVSNEIIWDLKNDPFGNLDNCSLDDFEVMTSELNRYVELGGNSLIETTSLSIGRDLEALQKLSQVTGVSIIAGSGFYLDDSLPPDFAHFSVDEVADQILSDLEFGIKGIRPGIIGEIGISSLFTNNEKNSLTGACIAQIKSQLPMQVHLPGWQRLGHSVLDVIEEVGVDLSKVVLCHMGPSGFDSDYQKSLADRGAWIQYDMIGMELYYADQEVQCPSDEDNAKNLIALFASGYGEQVLISQDIFIKSLLRVNGGPGYSHILQYFIPRLLRLGMPTRDIDQLIIGNPRNLFEK
jgi:phosphotriesterase-related protein